MRLFYTVNSPYARKARIVALEKHVDLTLEPVVLAAPDCPVGQYNPLGKVPVLVLGDTAPEENEAIYDSTVIVEYLDNRAPVNRLIPQDSVARIRVKRWESLADGVVDATVAVMLEKRRPDGERSPAFIDKQMSKVTAGLTALDNDLYKKKWCVNETFSLADIAVGCALGYLDLRFRQERWDNKPWQDKFPNLAKHYGVLAKRPSFKKTMPVPDSK